MTKNYDEYSQYLHQVQETFELSNGEESRLDRYVLGNEHYGLKYRNNNKLEIKGRLRVSHDTPGGEYWTKHSFGKKPLSHYREELIDLLKSWRLPYDESSFDRQVDVSISKRRNQMLLRGVVAEICELQIEGCSSSSIEFPITKWISVCFEGSESSVQDILKDDATKTLRRSIEFLHHFDDNGGNASTRPILGGYPKWIVYLFSRDRGNDDSTRQFIDKFKG